MVEQDAGNVMELMCTYPRKMLEANLTIQEADLCPQAAIIVQIKESEPKSP